MRLITATKSPLRCRGYDGRHHPIFTGFRYVKLKRNKALCECCYDKIKENKVSELKQAIIEYEGSGCTNMSKSLGIQNMPDGYALMLNSDGTHYFWITDSFESGIDWDKWAVYRGAMANSNSSKVG